MSTTQPETSQAHQHFSVGIQTAPESPLKARQWTVGALIALGVSALTVASLAFGSNADASPVGTSDSSAVAR
jgi:hypothetical protein